MPDEPPPSLIEYPSVFPVKVMGLNEAGFIEAISEIAAAFDPEFDASTLQLRPSNAERYVGITLTINATSREQLDGLYRRLSSHPLVKMVL
jgi:putative lipoic acid-binding regulatory protein